MKRTPLKQTILRILSVADSPTTLGYLQGETMRESLLRMEQLRDSVLRDMGNHDMIIETLAHPEVYYDITDRGRLLLSEWDASEALTEPDAVIIPAATPRVIFGSGTYQGAELGKTSHRPGAYDAFTKPSLIGGERIYRRG